MSVNSLCHQIPGVGHTSNIVHIISLLLISSIIISTQESHNPQTLDDLTASSLYILFISFVTSSMTHHDHTLLLLLTCTVF